MIILLSKRWHGSERKKIMTTKFKMKSIKLSYHVVAENLSLDNFICRCVGGGRCWPLQDIRYRNRIGSCKKYYHHKCLSNKNFVRKSIFCSVVFSFGGFLRSERYPAFSWQTIINFLFLCQFMEISSSHLNWITNFCAHYLAQLRWWCAAHNFFFSP